MTPEALDAEAVRVRAELAALSNTLVLVQQELGDDRVSRLLAANEQLVRAALLADSIAEKALMSLADLTHGQADAAAATGLSVDTARFGPLESALAMARRRQTRLAVICLGLDASSVADGGTDRAAGEAVMQAAVRRLESAFRRADTVCLEEGESALLVLAEVARAGDAARIAIKLVAALADSVQVDGRELQLASSIGIAVYPLDGADASSLLERAETAMRRARAHPGGGIEFAGVPAGGAADPTIATPRLQRAPRLPDAPLQDLREVNERLVIAAVQAQQQQLDSLDRTRELQVRFLAMVAHELRNPLMPIRTAAELLLRARNDESMLTRLQGVIQRQVVQMSRLVDDLLDTSRITSGQIRLERGSVDLATVLDTARDSCQAAIDSRSQSLEWSVATDPMSTEGDPVRLAQVFSNLLDNASKYTPRGGRIRLSAAPHGDSISIAVSDDGRGISATAMPHIFDLFAQDPRTLAFGFGGLGVGLAVVRELVDAHGGRIAAHSAGVDQGSRFVVTLRRSAAAAAA